MSNRLFGILNMNVFLAASFACLADHNKVYAIITIIFAFCWLGAAIFYKDKPVSAGQMAPCLDTAPRAPESQAARNSRTKS
jgi:hypothetical protein